MLEENNYLTLACPACGHIFQETIGSLRQKDAVVCARCTRVFPFEQDEFRVALQEARDALTKLRESLGLTK